MFCVISAPLGLGVYGGFHQIADHFWIAFAFGFLHDLANEKLKLAILAGADLGHDIAMRVDDAPDNWLEAGGIGDLREAFGGDDVGGGAARLVHLREDI